MRQPSETPQTGEPAAPAQPAVNPPTPESHGLRNLLERVEHSFFSSTSPTELYRYNYTKLAPAALIDTLPPAEKPRLRWYLDVALCVLRAVRNRAHWTSASATVDLSHVGLGTEDLSQLSLDTVKPEQLDTVKPEHLDGSGSGSGTALSVPQLRVLGRVVKDAIRRGLTSPLHVLEHVLGGDTRMPTGRPGSLADYRRLFATFPVPWFADQADSDEVFAYLRVAGFNPLVLQRVATLEAKFPVTEEQFRTGLGDPSDSLAQAGAEGRLFVCDYVALARARNGNFPAGPKYGFAPLALFALPRGTGPRRLKAVAIQCGQDPRSHRVFTPADGEVWRKAKLVVTVADFNYHETISHLARTHLLIGPMPIALHRHLPEGHSLRTLLVPHLEGTLSINDGAQSSLVAPGHQVDKSMAGTIEASRQLAVDGLGKPFNQLFLDVDLEARGVTGPELEYPYRDDARALWGAIERWVTAYVGLYYRTDADVRGDQALQAWGAELVSQEGGRMLGFGDAGDGRFQTVAYLHRALTMIVFTASAQHAAVNFPQADLMSYAPATPPAAYRAAPLSAEDSALNDFLDYLPPLELAVLQMDFLHLLGGVYYTQLGQYAAKTFRDDRVGPLLARFQQELQDLEASISGRNRTRFGPYPFLLPSRIPQSINI